MMGFSKQIFILINQEMQLYYLDIMIQIIGMQ